MQAMKMFLHLPNYPIYIFWMGSCCEDENNIRGLKVGLKTDALWSIASTDAEVHLSCKIPDKKRPLTENSFKCDCAVIRQLLALNTWAIWKNLQKQWKNVYTEKLQEVKQTGPGMLSVWKHKSEECNIWAWSMK